MAKFLTRLLLFSLFSSLGLGAAEAKNVTFDIYHYGRYHRTVTMTEQDYQRTASRLQGTPISLKPHASAEESRAAVQSRVNESTQNDEQGRIAAEAQEKRWEQDFEAREATANQREKEWKQENEQRRVAAEAQQKGWEQDFEARRAAAVERMNEWNRQAEERRVAAEAQQQMWRQQFDRLHTAALQGFDVWKMAR